MSKINRLSQQRPGLQTHFAVYNDSNLVANQVFEKERITIGRSRKADLRLDHDAVKAIHAEVYQHNRKVFLTNRFPQDGLQLNGRAVGLVELQQEDVIQIGPYSLRIEIIETETQAAAATDPQRNFPLPTIDVAFTEIFLDEEDEEDEEIWEAPFSLKSELVSAASPLDRLREKTFQRRLQIVRTIGDAVIDVHELHGREKYVVDTGAGRIRLIDVNWKGERSVCLLPGFSGYLQTLSGDVTADLDGYRKPEYLKNSQKQLYRIPLPAQQTVVVETPGGCYRIGWVRRHPTPEVTVAAVPTALCWRHWASSTGIHLFLLVCLALAMVLEQSVPEPPKPHFVKIEPAMLEKLQAPKTPPKPEPPKATKKATRPKPEPVEPKQHPKKMVKKPPAKKKAPSTNPVSRHANAGGGYGKGNIKNRNIKQAGLLSMLGSPSAGGSANVLVAVSNLDAVPVPGATDKDFTVGGLKGALGDGTISVATQGAILQTKGSKQVLRSAGAGGSGDVAALERGTTGKKKVQAMVTAKMNRKVTVKGGMSRERVKRVIDRHLEEITYCYETALMKDPSILGRIVFEWKILMNGRVGEIRIVASSVNSHVLHGCIKASIKAWQFPEPVGSEVVVSYPFVFDLVSF